MKRVPVFLNGEVNIKNVVGHITLDPEGAVWEIQLTEGAPLLFSCIMESITHEKEIVGFSIRAKTPHDSK